MGTRADFYVRTRSGRLDWRGSIAWDGYPDGIPTFVLEAQSTKGYCHGLYTWLQKRQDKQGDVTYPRQGWPWPWSTSATTDYAYVYNERLGKVLVYKWGRIKGRLIRWPDMNGIKNVRMDNGSGLIII